MNLTPNYLRVRVNRITVPDQKPAIQLPQAYIGQQPIPIHVPPVTRAIPTMAPSAAFDPGPEIEIETPTARLGMKVMEIALDDATSGDGQEIDITGNVLWVPYSTNATDLVKIRPGSQSDPIPATRGWFLSGIVFDRIWVQIPTGVADATLYIAYSFDPSEQKVRIQ